MRTLLWLTRKKFIIKVSVQAGAFLFERCIISPNFVGYYRKFTRLYPPHSRVPLVWLLVELLIDTLNTLLWADDGGSVAWLVEKILIIFIAVLCIHCRTGFRCLHHLWMIERIVYLRSTLAVIELVIKALYLIGVHYTAFWLLQFQFVDIIITYKLWMVRLLIELGMLSYFWMIRAWHGRHNMRVKLVDLVYDSSWFGGLHHLGVYLHGVLERVHLVL